MLCTPSLALKIGNSLGRICELVETDNLSTVDRDRSLMEEIDYQRRNNHSERVKVECTKRPHFTEDFKCVDAHIECVKVVAEKILRLCPSANNYATLAKMTLAQLIIFNRRREGEVSRMKLDTFEARKKSELNEDIAVCLTPLENRMCDFFTRLEIRGKTRKRSNCAPKTINGLSYGAPS
ncbi:hypothetical protein N1851_019816 [Merluccius polli]|uniref:Uncharacterized protein n=1 Tax=Merluccius polli TaxID=89951 RepID=A0AA47MLU5_MERPO|nr:hypothetical protein N1851_019816 [Merluccius polli]